jgi:hypothetical protein
VSSVDEIRAQAREVAAGWSPSGAPKSWQLTAGLFRVIAGHQALLGRLVDLPSDRLPALLASAGISFLVQRDRPEPLAGYFPEPGQPQPPFDSAFGHAAGEFISERIDEIMAVCRVNRYQMNEVARCTQIAMGIAATAAPDRPIGLVDLGTGAGLGLQLDRYGYRVGNQQFGPPAAALSLSCEVRGDRSPPPAVLPVIAERAGIELNPIDLDDPAALAWLQACAPPEASALTRLTAAAEVTRRYPARIVAGDVVDALPGVLESFPAQLPVIVIDAYMAVFLSAARLAALTGILASAGKSRPVTWLSLDPLVPLGPTGRDSVQGLQLPGSLVGDYQQRGVFAVLGARSFDGGSDSGRLLARAHPSGQWIEWISGLTARSPRSGHAGGGPR